MEITELSFIKHHEERDDWYTIILEATFDNKIRFNYQRFKIDKRDDTSITINHSTRSYKYNCIQDVPNKYRRHFEELNNVSNLIIEHIDEFIERAKKSLYANLTYTDFELDVLLGSLGVS